MSERHADDELAETLEEMLVPVRPPELFREHLRANLKLAGRQNAARRRYRRRKLSAQNWWLLVVLFSASITAGSLLAYLVRSRVFSHSL